jgi:serine/threonine protein kinase
MKCLPGAGFVNVTVQHRYRLGDLLDRFLPPGFECCKDLIEGMLQLDPSRRISASRALSHAFFADVCIDLPMLPLAETHYMDVMQSRTARIRPCIKIRLPCAMPPAISA